MSSFEIYGHMQPEHPAQPLTTVPYDQIVEVELDADRS